MFTKRRLIIFGAIFLTPPLLLLIFIVEEHYRGKAWLKRTRAELVAKGEKLTIDELKPSAIPDDENGMLLMPFGKLQREPEATTRRFVAPGIAIVLSKVEPGFLPASTSLRRTTPWSVLENWRTAEATNLTAIISALEKPRLAAKVEWEKGFNGSWSHFGDLKKCTVALQRAGLSDLHFGHYPQAHRLVLAGASIDRTLKDEPLLISQLVRMALRSISTSLLWEALNHDGWSDAQLAAWQQVYSKPDFRSAMSKATEMERSMGLQYFDLFRTGDQKLMEMFALEDNLSAAFNTTSSSSTSAPFEWSDVMDFLGITKAMEIAGEYILSPTWKFACMDQAEAYHIEAYQSLIESMREQAKERRLDTNWSEEFQTTFQNANFYDRTRFALTWMALPAMDRAMLKAMMADTLNEMAVTAIALERHRLKYHRYPEKLETLIPEFLSQAPVDFMVGGKLLYRLEANGKFTLWSAGENQTDDNGDPQPPDGQSSYSNLLRGRDIIWPKAANATELAQYLSSTNAPAEP